MWGGGLAAKTFVREDSYVGSGGAGRKRARFFAGAAIFASSARQAPTRKNQLLGAFLKRGKFFKRGFIFLDLF